MFSRLRVRLAALLWRRDADDDIDEELRYHFEREVERNVARGMSLADARHAARRALGNVTVAAEQARDTMRWSWLEEVRQDVQYAGRSFRRAPAFVATVAITIGIGLGLLITVFTLFDAYVLRPFVVRDPSALYDVSWRARDGSWHVFTWPQFEQLRNSRVGLESVFAYEILDARVGDRQMMGQLVTGNYFDMLGVSPALGRTLRTDDDAAPGASPVIVLSHETWRSSFGGDSTVIGRTMRVNGVPLRIIGVARAGFGGLSSWPYQYWVPMSMREPLHQWKRLGAIQRFAENTRVVGRLAQGVSPGVAQARLEAWLAMSTGDRSPLNRAQSIQLESRATSMPMTPELLALFGPIVIAFGLVMLIACANVSNMMLARGMARQREIGIRLALGAGRRRLVRQLLAESVLLALPAGLIGFGISRAAVDLGVRAMFATAPKAYVPYIRPLALSPDLRVVLFVIGGCAAAAMAFGLVPALQATRPNVVQSARGDFDTAFRPSRLRSALVVVQVTVSVLLLICAGVLLRSARRVQRLEPGMRTSDVVQLEMLDAPRARAIGQLPAVPGVREIASAAAMPLDGFLPGLRLEITGDSLVRSAYNIVSPNYFATLGIAVVRGRVFSDDEARGRAPVALVSEATATRLWPGRDPIGKTIALAADDDARLRPYRHATVIGVVRDVVPGWIGASPHDPELYFAHPLAAPGAAVLVRVAGDVDAMRDRIDHALSSCDSGAVQETHTLASSLAVGLYPFRAAYWVATAIGLIALALTITGIHGVMAYVVAQRKREFGIRLALGASPAAVVSIVLSQAIRLAAIGFAAGAALALVASIGIASVVIGVGVLDPLGYAIGGSAVMLACVGASYFPSRRAGLVDPVEALRADS
ncbi:MAG TPA: ADOP family duplicated permease [Gemmatimonadaceae bacterium]|nr:ADOP family duplicated permease [Gemmatimonadaceae bacterium]